MRTALLVSLVLLSTHAWAQSDGGAAPEAGAVVAPAAPTAADHAAKLDELWKTRDDAVTAKATDAATAEALKAFPDDYGVLWRAARVKWWLADGASDDKVKKTLGKEGWALAEKAVKARPAGVEGKYYVAVNIGAYSQGAGILTALGEGLEGKFVENTDAACKLDEAFDRHGCHTVKGRYHWELPWPKRDLDKSRVELKKTLVTNPEHLRCWLFLAETELKDGKAKDAKVAIDKVLAGPVDYDAPEARRIKARAKAVSEAIEKELK